MTQDNLILEENKNDEGSNYDAVDDDLSSVSHGLANKMLPAKTNVRASMMKETRQEVPVMVSESDDNDDFFDALEDF